MTLKRWHWIAIVLVTAGLVVMAPTDEGQVAKKSGRSDKTTRSAATAPVASASLDRQPGIEGGRVELELLSKLEILHSQREHVSDVFNQTTWYVPPPPPPASLEPPPPPPPPPAPVAPQLPFTYLGRYGESDTRTIILSKGEKVYTVTVGDTIENTYRIEKFTPGIVNLTYLPLNILQSLRTGEAL
jgi:hypothetical protein